MGELYSELYLNKQVKFKIKLKKSKAQLLAETKCPQIQATKSKGTLYLSGLPCRRPHPLVGPEHHTSPASAAPLLSPCRLGLSHSRPASSHPFTLT